jgi:hypothetical protein
MVAEQVRLLAGAGSVPPRVGDRPLAGDRSDHTPPPWLILVPSRVAHLVASYVGERGYFGLDPEAVTVVGLPDLEAEATRDAGVTGAAGAAAPEVYSSPMAVAWALIAAGRLTVPGGDGTLLWLPLAAPFEAAPADNVLRRHREAGAGVTAFAWEYRRGGGEAPPRSDAARLIPTGVMLCNRGTVGTIAEALTVRSLALRRDLILPPGPADLLSRNGDGSGWARGLAYVGVPEIVAAAGNGRIVARGGRPPAFVRTRGEAQQCRIQRGRRQSEVE